MRWKIAASVNPTPLVPESLTSAFTTPRVLSRQNDSECSDPYWLLQTGVYMSIPRHPTPSPATEVHMRSTFTALLADESGQGLVEYALIIALVAVGLIAILLVLRNAIGNVFNNAATQLNNAPTNPYP